MIKGYQTNAQEDAKTAEEWFHIEEEAYKAINQATDKQGGKKLKSKI